MQEDEDLNSIEETEEDENYEYATENEEDEKITAKSDIQPDRFNALNANPKAVGDIVNTGLSKPNYKKYEKDSKDANTPMIAGGVLGGVMLLGAAIVQGLISSGIIAAGFTFPPAGIALIVLASIAAVGAILFGVIKKNRAENAIKTLNEKEKIIEEKSLEAKIDVIENSKERINVASKVHIASNKENERTKKHPQIKNVPKQKLSLYNNIRRSQNEGLTLNPERQRVK